jgi:hypothetical protein
MRKDKCERMSDKDQLIQLKDKEADNEISLYLFEIILNDSRYGGEIPAYSWEDAQKMVGKFGGKVIGRAIEERQMTLCAVCAADLVRDLETVEPLPDEDWGEEFD